MSQHKVTARHPKWEHESEPAAVVPWFSDAVPPTELHSLGFRLAAGGTHLARTLMLAELGRFLTAAPDPRREDLNALVI